MKILPLLLLPIFFLSLSLDAQDDDLSKNDTFEKAVDKGSFVLSAGAGAIIYPFSDRTFYTISTKINADYSFHKYASTGVFTRYYTQSPLYYRVNTYNFGVRGNFHLLNLLSDVLDKKLLVNKLDIYASIGCFYHFVTIEHIRTGDKRAKHSRRNIAFVRNIVGVRYSFIKNLVGFIELTVVTPNHDLSAIGLALKF